VQRVVSVVQDAVLKGLVRRPGAIYGFPMSVGAPHHRARRRARVLVRLTREHRARVSEQAKRRDVSVEGCRSSPDTRTSHARRLVVGIDERADEKRPVAMPSASSTVGTPPRWDGDSFRAPIGPGR
jgi:hypothetical protein